MLDLDPPDHTGLRALVHKAFTPRLVERLRGRVETLAGDLLAEATERGRMDVIRDYAFPVPTTIIAEIFGVACDAEAEDRATSAAEPDLVTRVRETPRGPGSEHPSSSSRRRRTLWR